MNAFRFFCSLMLGLFYFSVCITQQVENKNALILDSLLQKAGYYLARNPDSSYYFADKALQIAIKISSLKHISVANQNMGRYYINKEDFKKATFHFLEALKIEEKRHDEKRIADLNNELGNIYRILENFNKALPYHEKALSIFNKLKDTLSISKSLIYLGNLHSSREYCEQRSEAQKKEDFTTAIAYFEKSVFLCEKIGNQEGVANGNVNIAAVYNKLEKPEKAYPYALSALAYFKKVNDWEGVAITLFDLGNTSRCMKQYNKSIDYYLESEHVAQNRNLTGGIQFLYEAMAKTYEEAGDYQNSLDYYKKYMTLRDSVYQAEKSKQIFELETKYQIERKEKEILSLRLKEKKRNYSIIVLALVIVVLSFSGLYIIYTIRRKRIIAEQANEIKEQKILQLEKDRQLYAAHALLEGEEKERGRMSRDLHDGLGGMLSGIKLKLTNMKGNYVINQENADQFDHAINLLDTSINELRRVAHNMMPEALIKFGLKDALQDFCDQISTNKNLSLRFNFFGEHKRFENSLEIALYRIAQELVNNALKHAKATEIIVQVVQEDNRIHLTVMDNGQGFDQSKINDLKSSGLQNIKARVESFNGHIDIDSIPGKGTEIGVEFKINS
jgi:two-component system NarL family sensor kinase